jgi:beta-N-acetylhexosaminidase
VLTACARGATHGRELSALGIHMNLAPVLDVWDNPQNSVIGERSYSSDPETVARLGTAYIHGLQAQGVLAVGKHFPGHGSTSEDSHVTLPVVQHDRAWMEAHELVPFRAALRGSVAAIMTAHVSFPLIDPLPDRPASLSPPIVSGLLREELGYDGLVLTDDMGVMEAITGRYEAGDAAVKALQAGSDMLIVVGPLARQRRMVEAIAAEVGSTISPERLDASVRRVLRAKQQVGLLESGRSTLASRSMSCSLG